VIALTAYFYRPIRLASQVACPALVVYAERDTLVPAARVQQLAAAMPKATLVALPVRHFDFYVGETFDQVVRLEADFLREQLCRRPA
jgi:pimeloyl-ACP methyl ester carboxylesterase